MLRSAIFSVIFTAVVVQAAAPLVAADGYLPAGKVDATELLPNPPADGSIEQKADLAEVILQFKAHTKADEKLGKEQKDVTWETFAPVVGAMLNAEKMPKTAALFERVAKDAKTAIDGGKDHWKRLRPYEIDPTLLMGEKEASPGYPSGHSTRGTVYSLLLAELFPDKADAILTYGREIGWRRVQLGKHYPTDIFAGRVLGRAIVRQLHANPEFERDFVAAVHEIEHTQLQTAGK